MKRGTDNHAGSMPDPHPLIGTAAHPSDRRLLDDSRRTGVWPDSVQVIGGQLSMRLPTG